MMLFVVTFLTAWSAAVPANSRGVQTVASVDLARYAGNWFEIARFPNRFQQRCAGEVQASYAVRTDGRVDVIKGGAGDRRSPLTAHAYDQNGVVVIRSRLY